MSGDFKKSGAGWQKEKKCGEIVPPPCGCIKASTAISESVSDALPAPALGLMPAPSFFLEMEVSVAASSCYQNCSPLERLLMMSVLVCAVHGVTVALKLLALPEARIGGPPSVARVAQLPRALRRLPREQAAALADEERRRRKALLFHAPSH